MASRLPVSTRRAKLDWRAAAEELGAALPQARLHPAVLRWAAARSAREPWGVAFSGGADSLALLLLLWTHWPERRARLRALHFDHRLRGRESRGDAVFCRGVCRALGVTLVEEAWQDAPRQVSEAEARAARMEFFARHSRVLWLGHQQDDVAETLLMRLARGSGAGGLAAPRPVQAMPRGRTHVRPLLTLKKDEVTAALRAAGVSWREDSSNAGDAFFRNRVRAAVVPAWQAAAGRDAVAGAARTRELLEEDDDALTAWLAELQPLAADGTLHLAPLAGKPRALCRRALHGWLLAQPRAGELSRQGFEALLDAVVAARPTQQSLGVKGFAAIRGGRLHFKPAGKPTRKFHRRIN